MKQAKLTILLLLLLSPLSALAQTFGNEWINYGQSYYKFPIFQDGIYRLDYNALSNANIPLTSFQSSNIQLFGKEREIPIFIEDGGDNSIDPGDYILFYAERNDGWLDSSMYANPDDIGNPAYSLYNDTLMYFFTWNTSTNNLRFTVETDVNFGAYSNVADYITYNATVYGSGFYHEGVRASYASSSLFTAGEGWGNNQKNGYSTNPNYTPDILNPSTPFPYTGPGAPNARFTGRSISSSNASGGVNHHLRWEFGTSNTIIQDTTWSGYKQIKCDVNLSPTLISNGTTPVTMRIVPDLGVATDFQAFQYLNIEYPRQLNFNGANQLVFHVSNDPQGKIRLDFSNVGTSNVIAMVFGDTPRIVPFATNGSFLSTLIPNSTSGADQMVVVKGVSLINDVTNISPVNDGGSAFFTDYSSIPDSALLMVYHKSLEQATNAYASYRSASGMSPYTVDVDQLYLQFGGGIPKHIYGIRRFVHYAYTNATQKPRALFLIGKGIREANINQTSFDGFGTRQMPAIYAQSLVPSYGQPSSDAAITAGLSGSSNWKPLIPTGRISVKSNQELQDYLEKVMVYETEQDPNSVYDTPTKDWQKHVLHFAGGSNATEQASFQTYMNAMEAKISDSLFGATVHQIYKTSSNPLDPTILAEVTDRIADGVSLMTYFGHATGTNSGFEINLDDPGNWNNQDRYPVMYVNSCYNGNVFQSSISKSEEFVQVANSGAIAYIASVGVGLAPNLNNYSQILYNNWSRDHYGKTLSEFLTITSDQIEGQSTSLYDETTCMQMVLNGDPMLKLNWHENPEIEITPDDLSFSPTILDWTVDSLEVQLNLTNLGRSVTDTFQIEITRSFPNGNGDSIYVFYYPELHHTDTLRFKIPLLPQISLGENTFTVRVDLPSFINEQYEEVTNNQIAKNLLINLDGIVPVIPYEFAVVPNDSVTVKASTTDPIAPFNTYRFEIDTIDFEGTLPQSPEYRYALVSGLGGVKSVNPSQWISSATGNSMPLVCEDSVVYFWRVAIEGDTIWHESSFQYIQGKTGWGQDHFFQFKKNTFSNVGYERGPRERIFEPAVVEIESNVGTSTSSPAYFYENNWYIDGQLIHYGIGQGLGRKIHVAWLDGTTLEPHKIAFCGGTDYGQFNTNIFCNEFQYLQNDSMSMANFCNFVNNVIPAGDYVLIYTPIETLHTSWNNFDSTTIYNTFLNLGTDSITAAHANLPFSFFVRKGSAGTKIEGYAPPGGTYQLIASVLGPSDSGVEAAPLIGPASNWGNVYWKQDPQEMPSVDTTLLSILAYDINGTLDTVITQEFTSNDSLINLNLLLDAVQYPYISLRANYLDTIDQTPAQIDRWHVLYSPLPEAAIDGSSGHYWSAGTNVIQEGDSISFAVDVRNIYTIDMDSLLVSYWVEDQNGVKIPINYPRQDSLRVPDVLRDTITFSTYNLGGSNSFWMEINPYVNGSFIVTDQPEQEHFNNLLQIPFEVAADDEHPILDVTFDGNHILNGDIVNPYGEVLITLKDDNPFLVMDQDKDTVHFGIYLTDPTGNQERVPFIDGSGNTVMQWIPADPSNLRFQIIWPTKFEMDGTYTLSVQGSDKSGNLSGDLEYMVEFEVIHESTITAMMNYPNPFSTSTRFVFTLTGSEVPDDILIQIMTVSGRVVREISEDELGPIHIGRNITEFAWDGTDEFGDPLANGVYLYRVKTRINGEAIEHRESGADQYFTKSFGKMYLLR